MRTCDICGGNLVDQYVDDSGVVYATECENELCAPPEDEVREYVDDLLYTLEPDALLKMALEAMPKDKVKDLLSDMVDGMDHEEMWSMLLIGLEQNKDNGDNWLQNMRRKYL